MALNIIEIDGFRRSRQSERKALPMDETFLNVMAQQEYSFATNQAKALFDFTVGMAADIYGHGSKQHCEAIDAARAKYTRDMDIAYHARTLRVAQLRAAIADAKRVEVMA